MEKRELVRSMDGMNLYFKSRGIDVIRRWIPEKHEYHFHLGKDGHTKMYIFIYPETNDYEERNEQMTNACEGMYKHFVEHIRAIGYIDTDIASTRTLAKSRSLLDIEKTPIPTKVHFSGTHTIVIWDDGTKTIVKCSNNDIYDPEKGLAMAFCKKMFGNDNSFKKHFKKWLPKEEPEQFEIKLIPGQDNSEALTGFNNLQQRLYRALGMVGNKEEDK